MFIIDGLLMLKIR